MKKLSLLLLLAAGCHYSAQNEDLSLIQIQDRNGLIETINQPDRLAVYESTDFLASQPYKKVTRVYKTKEKNRSRITTYHPNGLIHQYLEAEEMRANGMYREWFPNGQLKIEALVLGGTAELVSGAQEDWIFDAISKVWDEQGHLIASISYSKGMLDGKSIYYFPDGTVERELSYSKGSLNGEAIENWPDGTRKSQTEYKRGVKEGSSIGFFESGEISSLEEHSDGRLLKGDYYQKNGDLISQVGNGGGFVARIDGDEMTLIEYRSGVPNGLVQKYRKTELIRSFYIKNGMKHGEETEYFLSFELENKPTAPLPKLSVVWNENRIHGCVKTWYSSGQLHSQRDYCRNQRMGPSLAWYRDGSLMLYEEYEEDRLTIGQYYKMQKKEPVSLIANGNGVATLFDDEGSFLRKVSYLKGKPVDPEE